MIGETDSLMKATLNSHADNLHEYRPIAVRAWTGERKKRSSKKMRSLAIARLLVIDTETLTDTTQSLTFGSAKLVHIRWKPRQLPRTVYEYHDHEIEKKILFHADDLSVTDPTGYGTLSDYARARGIDLKSHSQFMEDCVYHWCVPRKTRHGKAIGNATLTFFNAPFDISRLAYSYGEGRGYNKGSFTFECFPRWTDPDTGEKPNQFRPRIAVNAIDSKKSMIHYLAGNADSRKGQELRQEEGRGQFLDLRQLIWGMTNEATSLARACELFNLPDEYRKTQANAHGEITPEYIEYNRQDVTATAELAVKVLADYCKHPIDLQATKVFSPASIAKAYLRKMGIVPMLDRPDIPSDPVMIGNATSTFYGGRAECHIRKTPVPVTVCDMTSMYPTVNILMGLWEYITAKSVSVVDATDDVRTLAHSVSVDRMLDPAMWRSFVGMVKVIPDGDILPVRANYSGEPGGYNLGVNHLHSTEPLWFTIPDVLASVLLTGRVPNIVRAVRLVPSHAKQPGLRKVELLDRMPVNPTNTDFFRMVIEERQSIKPPRTEAHDDTCACLCCRSERFLKVLANSGSYGIYVEMLRTDLDTNAHPTVYGTYDGKHSVIP